LHRLYWVPHGMPASEGAYVTYPAEEFYAMLSIESHRHQAILIGENLGTVPPEVNRSLTRHGIGAMFVAQYEVRPKPGRAFRPMPRNAIASLNTHDMPQFAAFWKGLDIADRQDLKLLKPHEAASERRLRARVRKSVIHFLGRRGRLKAETLNERAVLRALIRYLGASAARWVLLNLEDLWLEEQPQNTPGTSTERVNWRRKLRFQLERLCEESEVTTLLIELRRARR
jgi:4-alpha-glucanotransferase